MSVIAEKLCSVKQGDDEDSLLDHPAEDSNARTASINATPKGCVR